jgi:hypothetical protein
MGSLRCRAEGLATRLRKRWGNESERQRGCEDHRLESATRSTPRKEATRGSDHRQVVSVEGRNRALRFRVPLRGAYEETLQPFPGRDLPREQDYFP